MIVFQVYRYGHASCSILSVLQQNTLQYAYTELQTQCLTQCSDLVICCFPYPQKRNPDHFCLLFTAVEDHVSNMVAHTSVCLPPQPFANTLHTRFFSTDGPMITNTGIQTPMGAFWWWFCVIRLIPYHSCCFHLANVAPEVTPWPLELDHPSQEDVCIRSWCGFSYGPLLNLKHLWRWLDQQNGSTTSIKKPQALTAPNPA